MSKQILVLRHGRRNRVEPVVLKTTVVCIAARYRTRHVRHVYVICGEGYYPNNITNDVYEHPAYSPNMTFDQMITLVERIVSCPTRAPTPPRRLCRRLMPTIVKPPVESHAPFTFHN